MQLSSQPITAALELQADGITVRLSFSCQRPEFSTLLAEPPRCDSWLSAEPSRAEDPATQWAAASTPALLQAFEQAQSIVQMSLALHSEKQRESLLSQHPIGGAA